MIRRTAVATRRRAQFGWKLQLFVFWIAYWSGCEFTTGFVVTRSATFSYSAATRSSLPLRSLPHDNPDDEWIGDGDGDGDSRQEHLFQSLKTRTEQLLNPLQTIPLVVIPGCIVPLQVVTVKVQSIDFLSQVLIRQKDTNIPRFGLVGMTRRKDTSSLNTTSSTRTELLPVGVEVEVLSAHPVILEQQQQQQQQRTLITAESLVELKVRAIRTFEVVESLEDWELGSGPKKQGWIPAKVQFLDYARLEAEEADPLQVALAMQQAQEFTNADKSMKESKSLVELWLDLARAHQRYEGQVDRLLDELGEMPSWEEPSECAFWVAALINPIPSMGLAVVDVRAGLLTAPTALERTQIVLNALWNSIQRMDEESKPRYVKLHE